MNRGLPGMLLLVVVAVACRAGTGDECARVVGARAGTPPEAAVDSDAGLDASPSNDGAEPERRAEADRYVALEDDFDAELPDPPWARDHERFFRGAIEGELTEGCQIARLECRSSTCRIEVDAPSEENVDELRRRLFDLSHGAVLGGAFERVTIGRMQRDDQGRFSQAWYLKPRLPAFAVADMRPHAQLAAASGARSPHPPALPPAAAGSGWVCIKSTLRDHVSTCFRTEQQCAVGRAGFGGDRSYGPCLRQPRAACFTFHDKLQQTLSFDCAATFTACERQRAYDLSQLAADVTDVSDCGAVD